MDDRIKYKKTLLAIYGSWSSCGQKNMQYRTTLAKEVRCQGVGVHTGQRTTLVFKPALFGQGIQYTCPNTLEAHFRHIHTTHLSTTLQSSGGRSVAMVEHMLAACYGLGITDLTIDVDGSEAPIFDGSAQEYVKILLQGGRRKSREETSWIVLTHPIRIQDGNRVLSLTPGPPQGTMEVSLAPGVVQTAAYDLWKDDFVREIAPARTYAHLSDVLFMRQSGYIKGGSLDSALVLHQGRPLNAGGFRLPQECARHKILDLLGDFLLLGHFLYATVMARNSGHGLNHRMMKELMSAPHSFFIQSFSGLFPIQKKILPPIYHSRRMTHTP